MSSATMLSASDGGASTREVPVALPEPALNALAGSIYSAGDVLLDRYRLVSPLAEGGSGVVWVALNTVLGVEVAVKIITSSRHEPAAVSNRRAASEARLCAQLAHPAICRVLDFGFTDHRDPFVVSELLHGETLDDLLARETRLGSIRAVQLLLPILDGLDAAHHHGVVHRDVKPANIFLAHEGESMQPKLLDFGIARCSNATDGRVTNTGVVCGTPFYMSPEQARGSSDIDVRSDLWSFCITLYEALAGVPPFSGENYNEILWSILHSEPAPLETFEGVDLLLARIVHRGLNKIREQRWCSAAALSQELASWLLRQGVDSDIRGFSLRQRVPSSVAPESAKPSSGPPQVSSSSRPNPSRGSATASAKRRSRVRWASGAAGLVAVLATTASLALSRTNSDAAPRGEIVTPKHESANLAYRSVESSVPDVSAPPSSLETKVKVTTTPLIARLDAQEAAQARPATVLSPPRAQVPATKIAAAPSVVTPVAPAKPASASLTTTNPASAAAAPKPAVIASNRKPNALAFDFGL